MKKKPFRKLHLQRETLQKLDVDSLAQAQGGAIPTVVMPSDACPVPTGG